MNIDRTTLISIAIIMIFGFLCTVIWSYRVNNPKPIFADTHGKIVSEKIWARGEFSVFHYPKLIKNPNAKYVVGDGRALFSKDYRGEN